MARRNQYDGNYVIITPASPPFPPWQIWEHFVILQNNNDYWSDYLSPDEDLF